MTLTPRQATILQWIRDFMYARQRSPTVREIGAAFGINVNGVVGHLNALRDKGELAPSDGFDSPRGSSRGLVVLKGPCPFCGGER